ncbi:MAG TPA: hypothetical protein VKB75_17700 [Jatrophihabitans sp.]|nr:hypothetical protein [Jatrophihabitans sp.]
MHYPLTAERRDAVLDGLTKLWGGRPVVVDAQQVGHEWAPVTRLVFDGGTSVIVKTRRVDGEGHGGPAYLRREVAGLRTAEASDVAARVILTDDEAGVVVQSDLGTWPTLEAVLLGDDTDRAAAAMIDFARTVGRLHATTLGRRAEHEAALAEFGTNALVTDHGVRLVDFEGARFGHPGFDISFIHYPFPHHSANWCTLPEAIIRAADDAYRSTVALDGHDQLLAVGAAAALASRVTRLPLIARDDQTPHDSWRRRAQIVQQIGVFERLADRAGVLPDLARWSGELAAAMAARWSDATCPPPRVFPAFDQ